MEAATAMPKLWELGDELEAIGFELMENGGELTPELETRLDAVSGAFDEKVERVALFARSHIAAGLAADIEVCRLEKIKRSHERTADSLKAYLKAQMERTERLRVETPRVKVRVQNNGGSPVIRWTKELSAIPDGFMRVTLSVDGEAVRKAYTDGTLPEGFEIEPRARHLRID